MRFEQYRATTLVVSIPEQPARALDRQLVPEDRRRAAAPYVAARSSPSPLRWPRSLPSRSSYRRFPDSIAPRRRRVSRCFQRQHVCLGQIVDVNVVANAGSIGRGIVGAKQLQFGRVLRSPLSMRRNQVSFRMVNFADGSALVSSGGVEVSQAHSANRRPGA